MSIIFTTINFKIRRVRSTFIYISSKISQKSAPIPFLVMGCPEDVVDWIEEMSSKEAGLQKRKIQIR